MTEHFDPFDFQAEAFDGTARLFPLPNLVMFPHVIQPLHLFEPRYRAMVDDSLEGDRLIAMAILAPGWENDYDGCPAVYPIGCLGQITTYHRMDDGRYNLLLTGLSRILITGELETSEAFRRVKVELLDDASSQNNTTTERTEMRRQLVDQFRRILPSTPEARRPLEQLLEEDLSLDVLTDMIAYSLKLELDLKIRLLGERDATRRARMLVEQLSGQGATVAESALREFPPGFSAN